MFLVNSRHRHFSATTPGSHSQYAHPKWHPFSRSYGVILPSSLTRVRSNALGYSPHPPVSVSGTVCNTSRYEVFLGSLGSVASPHGSASRLRVLDPRICLRAPPTRLHRVFQHPDHLPSCVTPSLKQGTTGTGILTRFPSATRFRLALGADLPWEDYLYPGNLGFTANRFFTCFLVTHASIVTSLQSKAPPDAPSTHRERSPTNQTYA